MSKQNLPQSTVATDTIQNLATRPTESASELKAKFDKYSIDDVDYTNNTLIPALESTTVGDAGANTIGLNAVGVTADNVNDGIAEVQANISGAALGEIPDNTITELKMAAEMKKQAGGVYPYNDGDTNATNISTNTSNIGTIEDELDILRTAKDSTGTTNAYILDTPAVFDYAVDGNLVNFNPNFTNSGSATIAIDGTTKAIRKFDIDTDSYVILEAEDIKKNNPTQLRFDVSEDFFVLPLKGALSNDDKANLIATNIRDGVYIEATDVTGTLVEGPTISNTANKNITNSYSSPGTVDVLIQDMGDCFAFQLEPDGYENDNPYNSTIYGQTQNGDSLNAMRVRLELVGSISGRIEMWQHGKSDATNLYGYVLSCSGFKNPNGTWNAYSTTYDTETDRVNRQVVVNGGPIVGNVRLVMSVSVVTIGTATQKFDGNVRYTRN